MPWCPQCKNEYREGIKICADCGCELVEEEQFDHLKALHFGDEEQMNSLKKFLEYNKLKGVEVHFDDAEKVYELFVRREDWHKASQMLKVFYTQEAKRKLESENEETTGDDMQEDAWEDNSLSRANLTEKNHSEDGNHSQDEECSEIRNNSEEKDDENGSSSVIYFDNTERAQENRSSAWILLFVGGIGLIVMILGMLEIIPLHIGNPYLFYGVMSVVFLLFIVMGVISMKNAKIFAKKAESENTLRDTMMKWYMENLDADSIDEEIGGTEETAEEILYFKRVEKIKEKLNRQFMNLDQVFLEHYIDEEVYDQVFSEGKDDSAH